MDKERFMEIMEGVDYAYPTKKHSANDFLKLIRKYRKGITASKLSQLRRCTLTTALKYSNNLVKEGRANVKRIRRAKVYYVG